MKTYIKSIGISLLHNSFKNGHAIHQRLVNLDKNMCNLNKEGYQVFRKYFSEVNRPRARLQRFINLMQPRCDFCI